MPPDTKSHRVVRFGVFEVDLAARELRKRGVRVKLQDQPFRLLQALIDRPGQIISREEIQAALWPDDTFVDFDHGVSTAVKKIRAALGDSADSPRFVETVPRHGYRFLAPTQRVTADTGQEPLSATEHSKSSKPRWSVLAMISLLAVAGLVYRQGAETGPQPSIRRLSIAPEASGAGLRRNIRRFPFTTRNMAAISPDGSHIAYWSDEQPSRLWAYRFDSGEAWPLEGTADGSHFFWSPDSLHLTLYSGGVLKRVPREGGAIVSIWALPPALESFEGGAWSPDGGLILMSVGAGGGWDLYSVPAAGGQAKQVLEGVPGLTRPQFLPFEEPTLLVTRRASTFTLEPQFVDLNTGETFPLGVSGSYATYAPSGHVLYLDNDVLWAIPVSARERKRTGDAFLVETGVGPPSVAENGIIVASEVSGKSALWRRLSIRGRDGTLLGTIGPSLHYAANPAVSPDGRNLAVSAADRERTTNDIWLFDLGGKGGRRIVTDNVALDHPTWHPNGRDLVFRKQSVPARNADFYIVNLDAGTPAAPLLISGTREAEPAWSPNGETLIYQTEPLTASQFDIEYRLRSPEGSLGEPAKLVATEFNEVHPKFSPNGKFVAYTSAESGGSEVYLRRFPEGAPSWRVSDRGGANPRWSRAGDELYWIRSAASGGPGDTVMAARIDPSGDPPVEEIRVLFKSEMIIRGSYMYDVTPDGRFVIVEPDPDRNPPASTPYIKVIENWTQLDPAAGGQEQRGK